VPPGPRSCPVGAAQDILDIPARANNQKS